MLVAGAAAALLISASPAHAGVKFEKVQTKKVSPLPHGPKIWQPVSLSSADLHFQQWVELTKSSCVLSGAR